ncbi:MAG: ABC transporter permease [Opitutaceae bacterium]|jgi:predicted permease
MLSDLRFAFRSLAKSPGFTIVAALTLALGIGASTTVFSALRALVIEPFSYPRADRIMHLWSNERQVLSTADYLDIRDQSTSFSELGAYSPRPVNLGGTSAQSLLGIECTAGLLRAFGVPPMSGRWFETSDEQNGAPPVVIISHSLWLNSFGGDPGMIGRTIRLDGGDVTVVGIMPASFEFTCTWLPAVTFQVWRPLPLNAQNASRGNHWLLVVGCLKDGVTQAAADAEIKAIGLRLKAAYPETNTNKPFLLRSFRAELTRPVSSYTWMLFAAACLVLLVACANVASMLLARGARRMGELALRSALGATRGKILRLTLIESLLLALAGTAVGLVLASNGTSMLASLAPISEARRAAMRIDGTVLAFAVGAALVTSLVAGLPSAVSAMRVSVNDVLRSDSRCLTGSRTRHNLLRVLIIAQVAVALVLANGAALFTASYARLLAANGDMATEHVLSASVGLLGQRYENRETRTRFYEQFAAHAATLPGVSAAGFTSKLPLEGGSSMDILVNDESFDPTARRTFAEVSAVTPGYFDAAGIRILRGRTLQPADASPESIGVVVNRTLAEACWPNQNPIGKIIRPNKSTPDYRARVVGVVESTRQRGPLEEPLPEIFRTIDRAWAPEAYLIVRSPQPAAQLAPLLRRELAAMDPDLPLAQVRTFQQVLNEGTMDRRLIAGLVNCFIAVALALVAVGLYGTLSFHILQRTREIGVRLALGAERSSILRLVFRQGFSWVLIGAAGGVACSLALAGAMRSLIWGISPFNPLSLLCGTIAVVVAALLACWLPARRATRVDPIAALRAE